MESDSGGPPIGSEGGRTYAHAEILDHNQTLAWCKMAGFGKGHLSLPGECARRLEVHR